MPEHITFKLPNGTTVQATWNEDDNSYFFTSGSYSGYMTRSNNVFMDNGPNNTFQSVGSYLPNIGIVIPPNYSPVAGSTTMFVDNNTENIYSLQQMEQNISAQNQALINAAISLDLQDNLGATQNVGGYIITWNSDSHRFDVNNAAGTLTVVSTQNYTDAYNAAQGLGKVLGAGQTVGSPPAGLGAVQSGTGMSTTADPNIIAALQTQTGLSLSNLTPGQLNQLLNTPQGTSLLQAAQAAYQSGGVNAVSQFQSQLSSLSSGASGPTGAAAPQISVNLDGKSFVNLNNPSAITQIQFTTNQNGSVSVNLPGITPNPVTIVNGQVTIGQTTYDLHFDPNLRYQFG